MPLQCVKNSSLDPNIPKPAQNVEVLRQAIGNLPITYQSAKCYPPEFRQDQVNAENMAMYKTDEVRMLAAKFLLYVLANQCLQVAPSLARYSPSVGGASQIKSRFTLA